MYHTIQRTNGRVRMQESEKSKKRLFFLRLKRQTSIYKLDNLLSKEKNGKWKELFVNR